MKENNLILENWSEKELLNYAIENGILNHEVLYKQIEMKERERYLALHTSKIWKSTDENWYTYLPDMLEKGKKKLVKRKTKKALEDVIVQHYREQENAPHIQDVFAEWNGKKLEYGEILKQTYDRYETDFSRFFHGTKIEKVQFRHITEDMLEEFIKCTIREKALTAKAWGNLRTLINGIFKYGKRKGYTNISITQFMGDLELSPKAFRKKYFADEDSVFTDNEVGRIVDYILQSDPTIINLGIILAFQSGLRAGELSALKFSDLDGNVLNVSRTEVRFKGEDGRYVFEVRESTKGEQGRRKVILSDEAVKLVKQIYRMAPFEEYLFTKNGKRIKAKAFTVKIKKICGYIGIKPRSLHKARKTYGTKLLNAGIDEKLIEKQMGHTDIRTTKGFYYFNNREIEEAKKIITSAIG